MKDLKFVRSLFEKIKEMKARNVQLGHGSFLTIDFGEDILVKVKTRQGVKEFNRGEWHLWVYMCVWRLDIGDEPFIGSDDKREIIKEKIVKLENKKLCNVEIVNKAFDVKLEFEDEITLFLFSFNTQEFEQWMLFTPDKKVMTAGPGKNLSYEKAGSEL